MKLINRLIAAVGCAILRAWLRLDHSLTDDRKTEIVELLALYDLKFFRG